MFQRVSDGMPGEMRHVVPARLAIVRGLAAHHQRASLWFGGQRVACALGSTGRRAVKREGDGATPIGTWRLIEVRYRADRMLRPRTRLPCRPLRVEDGWCDAVGDRNYNRPVRHPYAASAERMWRDDHVYDLVVVTSHNCSPRRQGSGSAIFMHLARPEYAPTAGCIALAAADMRAFLATATRHTRLFVCS